jgi:hypothetical protein
MSSAGLVPAVALAVAAGLRVLADDHLSDRRASPDIATEGQ